MDYTSLWNNRHTSRKKKTKSPRNDMIIVAGENTVPSRSQTRASLQVTIVPTFSGRKTPIKKPILILKKERETRQISLACIQNTFSHINENIDCHSRFWRRTHKLCPTITRVISFNFWEP